MNYFFCFHPYFPFVYILIGALIFGNMSGHDFVDSVYFCIVSASTVGYGDIVPTTRAQMVFVCLYIFVGFVTFSMSMRNANHNDDAGASFYWDRLKRSIFWIFVLIGIGSALFYMDFSAGDERDSETLVRPTIIQSVYWAVVTLTSVGYGDLTVESTSGKIFVSIFIILGVSQFLSALGSIVELTVESEREDEVKSALQVGLSEEVLAQLDTDGDREVDRCEFLTSILIHMKKISQDDVKYVNELFDRLDSDKNGHITKDELVNSSICDRLQKM